jgi:hypothetical protein
MFTPSQDDVRRFFCAVYTNYLKTPDLQLTPTDPLENLAFQWIAEHPEYHLVLSNVDDALITTYSIDDATTNPFLHLSMHLSISEQCSIDQPKGIRSAVEQLTSKKGDLHAAHHEAMECLGVMLWESQRSGRPPDGEAYTACVSRRSTKD